MKNFLVKDPNFSIIVPGPCNAKCSFCFWKQQKVDDWYLLKLRKVLNSLPKEFIQISLTGGEPCLSNLLVPILQSIDERRFSKIVLTTNGTSLLWMLEKHSLLFKNKIKYINISRHCYDDTFNKQVFNSKTVPDKSNIKEAISFAKNLGINVTINCVISESTSEEEIYSMVGFVNEVGAKNICFRKQHGNLESTNIENKLSKIYPVITEGGCPVCRSKLQKILGTYVSWKASSIEPSKEGDGIFEAVFHPNGKLTADWEGKIELDFNEKKDEEMDKKALAKIADALISIGNELKNLTEEENKKEEDVKETDPTSDDYFPPYDEGDEKFKYIVGNSNEDDITFPLYDPDVKPVKKVAKKDYIADDCHVGWGNHC